MGIGRIRLERNGWGFSGDFGLEFIAGANESLDRSLGLNYIGSQILPEFQIVEGVICWL